MDFRWSIPGPIRTRRRSSAEAEELVASFLRAQGWAVLARNFRHIGCELDIVARKGATVVAVEVKARRGRVELVELLLPRKRRALERGLSRFVGMHQVEAQTLRIDLALVWPDAVEYQVNV